MSDDMAWAIFTREFNYSNPKSRFSYNVQPSADPQSNLREVVEAAIAQGAAIRFAPPTKYERNEIKERAKSRPKK